MINLQIIHATTTLPFEIAVKDGKVASVMCSYNSVNGSDMCENAPLLTGVLREQWGFEGYVQSDFFAAHSVAPTLLAGMDLEMPGLTTNIINPPAGGPYFTSANLSAALAAGQITESNINNALMRRYTQMFRLGIFDRPVAVTPIDAVTDGQIARAIGEQSAVLLKNSDNMLPIDTANIRSIAVIGQPAYVAKAVSGCCGGSSDVIPLYTVTPLQGVQNALQALGSSASVNLMVVNSDGSNLAQAVDAVRSADVVIVLAGALTDEGADRMSIALPDNQDSMISAVAAANPRTVVVLKDGDAVLMPWLDGVPAVLEAWFPGQEDGNIVARLLFGLANPSGKLPITYPRAAGDVPARTPEQFRGVPVNGAPTIAYSERLEVGYRWYDAQKIEPLFSFGHGLSYTTFSISDLEVQPTADGIKPIKVQFFVENTGNRAGAEVPQVYLGLPASTGEPPKRLVAFKKVWLDPRERRRVELTIDPKATNHPLGVWDDGRQRWITAGGNYQVYVGNSAANIAISSNLTLCRLSLHATAHPASLGACRSTRAVGDRRAHTRRRAAIVRWVRQE